MFPSRLVSITRLREAAQARVAASSRRAVAREIGLQPRGLEVFLAGANPHPKTVEKLLRWYREQIQEAEGPPISGSEALRVLVRALPPQERSRATIETAALLRRFHEHSGVEIPEDLRLDTVPSASSGPTPAQPPR